MTSTYNEAIAFAGMILLYTIGANKEVPQQKRLLGERLTPLQQKFSIFP